MAWYGWMVVAVVAIAIHVAGIVYSNWWKKWIFKILGVPKEARDVVLAVIKALQPDATGKIRVTDNEWKGIIKELEDILAPPK